MNMFHKVLGCGTVAVALAFGASTTQAQNLLVNGSFESNTTTPNPITLAGAVRLLNRAHKLSLAAFLCWRKMQLVITGIHKDPIKSYLRPLGLRII